MNACTLPSLVFFPDILFQSASSGDVQMFEDLIKRRIGNFPVLALNGWIEQLFYFLRFHRLQFFQRYEQFFIFGDDVLSSTGTDMKSLLT